MAGLEAKVTVTLVDKVTSPLRKIQNNINNVNTLSGRANSLISYWPVNIQKAVGKLKSMSSELKQNNTLIDDFDNKLKGLAAAYGGVMTIRAVVTASDTITGTENRLNYANGGDAAATEASMDKMYAASLRARTDYGAMMSNVGKSMALAGDKAFQGNIDNAIKFQETMAKAYAIGDASAAEQSSSMYQMVQALGSGILQGDELRSVREGAPLAYKEIEKFAQKTLQTEESLKDLASQGKITSEMVVAAMMNASKGIDEAFGKTNMTIAQAFTNLKTVALNSFRPIQDKINEFINSEKGEKVFQGLTVAIQVAMRALSGLVTLFIKAASWIVDNWYWIQWIVYAVAIAVSYLAVVAIGRKLVLAIIKIKTSAYMAWLPWLLLITLVIVCITRLAKHTKNGMDFIISLLWWVAVIALAVFTMILIYAMVTGKGIAFAMNFVWLFWVAVIALMLALVINFCGQVMGVLNVVKMFFVNFGKGILAYFRAAMHNLALLLQNPWEYAKAAFWGWVAELIEGIKFLEPVINAVANAFGAKGFTLSGVQNIAKQKKAAAETAMGGKIQYLDEAFHSAFSDGWVKDAYNSGYAFGKGIKSKVNTWGNRLKNKLSSPFSGFDGLAKDPSYQLDKGTYDPNELAKGVGNIDDNTGKIKDSMDLTQEDLEYLRKVADMEWKKEFTTANIVVDMKNNNTINNQGDLDGWVSMLSDKLYEELDMVANGVYA